jgi:queuine tRNA-ribosyltransferase
MARDRRPLEEGCDCWPCSRFTRAYVHHLFRARELLGATLVAEHNLRFTTRLLEQVRDAISAGRLAELRAELLG